MIGGPDWGTLRHAYGSAADVPGMLKGLASSDPVVRETALDGLYGSVHHQGDVHDSTIACIRPLCALATDPAVEDRHMLLTLLGSIAESAQCVEPPAESLDPQTVTEEPASPDTDDEDTDDEDGEMLSALHRQAAREVLRTELARMTPLVADPDPAVRERAALLLARFSPDRHRVAEALSERVAVERDPEARQGLATALGALLRPTEAGEPAPAGVPAAASALRALAAPDGDPGTVLTALAALARGLPEQLPADVPTRVATVIGHVRPFGTTTPGTPRPGTPTLLSHLRTLRAERTADAGGPDQERTSEALDALHTALGDRVAQRHEMVLYGLRHSDPAGPQAAVRRAGDLYNGWRVPDPAPGVALLHRVLGESAPDLAHCAATELLDCRLPLDEQTRDAAVGIAAAGSYTTAPDWERNLPGVCLQLLAAAGDPRTVDLLGPLLSGRAVPERLPDWCTWLGPHAVRLGPALATRFGQAVAELAADDEAPEGHIPPPVQRTALALLAAGVPETGEALTPLLEALADLADADGAELHPFGAQLLRDWHRLGAAAEASAPLLHRLTRNPSAAARVGAAHALWRLTGETTDVVPVLASVLRTPPGTYAAEQARHHALDLALDMRQAAAELTGRLRELTAAGEPAARARAALALLATAPDQAERAWAALSEAWQEERSVRPTVAAGLRGIVETTPPAAFRTLLRAELADVRRLGNTGNTVGRRRYDCARDETLRADCAALLTVPGA
ncbi:hypothetical protein ACFV3R_12625 [Streptomyces sp. NPDC059740]|uniref:hypothetical protein n=1 Tax=Streptomyces sp. NPDC059740 TaxID=3346926 RepID=UPI003654C98C